MNNSREAVVEKAGALIVDIQNQLQDLKECMSANYEVSTNELAKKYLSAEHLMRDLLGVMVKLF